jgi:hypothetical protein
MSSRDSLSVAFFLARKKALAARVNFFLLPAFIVLLGYVWLRDSFSLCFRAYLFLFPYLFLFVSQDMVRDEVDSGALENVLFLRGRFRGYLLKKGLFLGLAALSLSIVLFLGLAAYGLISREFLAIYLLQFAAGVAAGVYYLSLGGLLSFSFKGGSNVLIVILAQVFLFIWLLLAAAKGGGLIDSLDQGSLAGLVPKLKFVAFAAVLPNVVSARRFVAYSAALLALSGFLLAVQWLKVRKLELRKNE